MQVKLIVDKDVPWRIPENKNVKASTSTKWHRSGRSRSQQTYCLRMNFQVLNTFCSWNPRSSLSFARCSTFIQTLIIKALQILITSWLQSVQWIPRWFYFRFPPEISYSNKGELITSMSSIKAGASLCAFLLTSLLPDFVSPDNLLGFFCLTDLHLITCHINCAHLPYWLLPYNLSEFVFYLNIDNYFITCPTLILFIAVFR